MKTIITYIICLALSFSNNSINSLTTMKDNALKYMNTTYSDDSFTFVRHGEDIDNNSEFIPYHEIIVSSKKYPDKEISVYCDKDSDVIILDSYLQLKYEDTTEKLIQSCINNIAKKNYVSYDINCMNGLSKEDEKTFAHYRSHATSDIYFEAVIEVDDDYNKMELTHQLEKELTGINICCSGKIYVNSKMNMNILNDDTFKNYRGSQFYDNVLTFEMDNTDCFATIDWLY